MKLKIYLMNVKSRFTTTKSIAAQPTQGADKSEHGAKRKKLSPQEREKKFLKEMADAYNELKLAKQIKVRLAASNLKAVCDDSGRIASHPNAPAGIRSLLTDATVCLRTPALTGITLFDQSSVHFDDKFGPHVAFRSKQIANASRTLLVDDFEPIKHLGRGAFGNVFLVRDKLTNRFYALKAIDKERIPFAFYSKIFEEQRVGKSLAESKWAMGVEGSFDDSDNFYMLMKYGSGGDLLQRIRNFGAPEDKLLHTVFAELVLAVEDLHKRRIMHRDLKLENILIDEQGHIVLADFGLSKASGVDATERPWEGMPAWAAYPAQEKLEDVAPQDRGRDLSAEHAGTPGYQAPEQLYGKRQHSYEADIWSLGVILHVFLTGMMPFGTNHSMPVEEVNHRVLTLPLTPPSYLTSKQCDLLSRMLEKDPRHRIAIPEIKAHPMFRGLDWDVVAKRELNSMQRARLYRGTAPHLVQRQPNLTIPAGDAYEPGQAPYPWFNFAAPSLTEPADPIPDSFNPPIVPIAKRRALSAEDEAAPTVASNFYSLKSGFRSSSQKKSEKRGVYTAIMQHLQVRFGMLVEVKPKAGGARMVID